MLVNVQFDLHLSPAKLMECKEALPLGVFHWHCSCKNGNVLSLLFQWRTIAEGCSGK